MKASSAEFCENTRFQILARTDLQERLKKKKMKALVPHIVQALYFVSLAVLCVGLLVVSRGLFSCGSMVSFVTSLGFLIEPVQVMTCSDQSFCMYFLIRSLIFSRFSLFG